MSGRQGGESMTRRTWVALSTIFVSAWSLPAMGGEPRPFSAPRAPGPLAIKRQKLAELHRRIAFELYEQQDLGWAARHFQEALHMQPRDAPLHATLGDIYAAQKELQ